MCLNVICVCVWFDLNVWKIEEKINEKRSRKDLKCIGSNNKKKKKKSEDQINKEERRRFFAKNEKEETRVVWEDLWWLERWNKKND